MGIDEGGGTDWEISERGKRGVCAEMDPWCVETAGDMLQSVWQDFHRTSSSMQWSNTAGQTVACIRW